MVSLSAADLLYCGVRFGSGWSIRWIGWQNTSKGKVLSIYRRGCFMVFLSDHRNLIGVIRLDSATAAAQRDRTGHANRYWLEGYYF